MRDGEKMKLAQYQFFFYQSIIQYNSIKHMGSHQLLSIYMIVLKVDWSITDVYTGFVDDNNNDDMMI